MDNLTPVEDVRIRAMLVAVEAEMLGGYVPLAEYSRLLNLNSRLLTEHAEMRRNARGWRLIALLCLALLVAAAIFKPA